MLRRIRATGVKCVVLTGLALAVMVTLALPARASTVYYRVGTTGTYDEQANNSNVVDSETEAGSLAYFKTAVAAAYASDNGGVVDFTYVYDASWNQVSWATSGKSGTETGEFGSPLTIRYGVSNSQTISVGVPPNYHKDSAMLHTRKYNDSSIGIPALSGCPPATKYWADTLIISQRNSTNPVTAPGTCLPGELYWDFTSGDVGELAITSLAANGVFRPSSADYSLNVTASYSGGGTETMTTTMSRVGGVLGADDTFFYFRAPRGESITRLHIEDSSHLGVIALDDLAVIKPTVVMATPVPASLTWTGASSSEWNTRNLTAKNWTNDADTTPDNFFLNDSVTFGNVSNTAVYLQEKVTVGDVIFNNDADHPYTVSPDPGTQSVALDPSQPLPGIGDGVGANHTGNHKLIKNGVGPVTLSFLQNTYSGGTEVKAGTLLVNNSTLALAGTVTVESGATLRGKDSSVGNVTVQSGGFLAPGASATVLGGLTVTSLVLESGSSSTFRIGPTSRDSVMASAAVTYGGSLNVSLYDSPTLTAGAVYDLFDFPTDSYSGTFSSISLPPLPSSLKWHDYGSGTFDYATGQIMLESAGPSWFTSTWSGSPTSTAWNNPDNWEQGIPGSNVGDQAILPTDGLYTTVALEDLSPQLAGITFSTSATPGSYTIGQTGDTGHLDMKADGVNAVVNNEAGTHTIAAAMTLSNSLDVTVADGAQLSVTGLITGADKTLTKLGTGELVLGPLTSGQNDYGSTVVTAGTLTVASANALPAGKSLSIGSGGTLILGGGMAMGQAATAEPVPEPGTLALLAIAALTGVMFWRKTR